MEVGITMVIKNSNGSLALSVLHCGCYVKDLVISLDGGASWFYQGYVALLIFIICWDEIILASHLMFHNFSVLKVISRLVENIILKFCCNTWLFWWFYKHSIQILITPYLMHLLSCLQRKWYICHVSSSWAKNYAVFLVHLLWFQYTVN